MSTQDPDVRPEQESTLRDQLARSEERIGRLEAQLAVVQKSLPAECAGAPQTPATPPARPPISMSAFNNNLSGPSTEAVAATVRAAANARNAPSPFPSLSNASHDGIEPTARLNAEELSHAHRALNRPRTKAYRRIEAGLLCLACGALWAGVWQMRTGERNSQRHNAPQILAAVPPTAYGMPPVPVSPVSAPPQSAPPQSAPAPAPREAGRQSLAVGMMNGRTMVEPDAAPRVASAPRLRASVPVPVSAPRHARTNAANARQDAGIAETRSYGRSAAARRMMPPLPSVILPTETPTLRREPNRKTLAVAHRAGLKHKSAQLVAFVPRRAASFKPHPHSAFVSAPLPEPRGSYGLGSGRSESFEEQVEEQAEAVHGTRAAAYDRDDRREDIEANVDHAIQTLDKMKALLDNMEQRRKAPAHP